MTAPPQTVPHHAAPVDDEARDWLAWLDRPDGRRWIKEQLDHLYPPLLSKEYDPDYLIRF